MASNTGFGVDQMMIRTTPALFAPLWCGSYRVLLNYLDQNRVLPAEVGTGGIEIIARSRRRYHGD
jgi:hypothetical protein